MSVKGFFILFYLVSTCFLICSTTAFAQEFPKAVTIFANDSDTLVNAIINSVKLENSLYTNRQVDSLISNIHRKYGALEKDERQSIAYQACLGYLQLKLGRNNEAFPYFAEALQFSENLESADPMYGFAHGNMGAYLNYYAVYDLSISHLKKSLPGLKNLNVDNSFYESNILDQIILSHYKLGQIDSAFHYQKLEIAEVKKVGKNDLTANILNNIGLYLHSYGYYQEALEKFDEGLSYLDTLDEIDHLTYVNIEESKAHALIKIGSFQEGINLIRNAFKVRKKFGQYNWSIQALNYVLQYYVEAGDVVKAYEIALKEEPYFGNKDILNDRTINFYKSVGDIYVANGKASQASKYLNAYYRYTSEKYAAESEQLANRDNLNEFMRVRIQSYEKGLEIEKLAQEKLSERVKRLVTFAVVVSLLSLAIIALLVIIARNKRKFRDQKILQAERNQKVLKLENKNLEYEIQLKEKDIRRIAADNKVRTSTKMQFLDKLYHIQTLPSQKIERELFMLTREFDQSLETEKEMSFVQDNISEINASFELALAEKIPGLSRQEMKIANLIKIGLNNQQIASMLNKAESTIRSYKFRMKQKAGLANARVLEDLIKSL